MLKGQDEDGDAPKAEENNETEEGAEAETQAGKDGEIQEVAGNEEQLTVSSSAGLKADEISVTEKEGSAEDGLGNRFVMIHFFRPFIERIGF